MTSSLVPFGKYRGQPIEVLAADSRYREWLASQPWFREQHPALYAVVINYGTEPQDSPEHNQMQALFLADSHCLRLAAAALPLWPEIDPNEPRIRARMFEARGWDVTFEVEMLPVSDWPLSYFHDDIYAGESYWRSSIFAELKPDLGDDYPAVLRQVSRYEQWCLGPRCVVARRHSFTSVTWEQVKQIYADSHILLLTEQEIIRPRGVQRSLWEAAS